MWPFKSKAKKESPPVMETSFRGGELHVNPGNDISISRLEARFNRVDSSLNSGKFDSNPERKAEFEKIRKRLSLQLQLKKGDF